MKTSTKYKCPSCGDKITDAEKENNICFGCQNSIEDDDLVMQPCDECDRMDACMDFGCAIKNRIIEREEL